jgi:ribosomal protein S18 acetylase RimI-like enzyme
VTLRLFAEHVEGAWLREAEGAHLFVSGVRAASLNVVMAHANDPPAAVIEELLDAAAATGLPYSLNARPGALAALAERRGLSADEDVPLMRLDRLDAVAAPDLTIRTLPPGEATRGVELQAAAFQVPQAMFVTLTTPRMLAAPGVRLYVGELGGELVTTAMAFTIEDAVGIFNVATLPAHRRRGYGSAITARAVADGLAAGGAWAWLESSQDGRRTYECLGFRTVETRTYWRTQNTFASSQSAAK